ncbi:MAG: VWA domain-containing protein [Clostridia bacterium]|nr:VWA domain-containing protein [Clostridia bacterium]
MKHPKQLRTILAVGLILCILLGFSSCSGAMNEDVAGDGGYYAGAEAPGGAYDMDEGYMADKVEDGMAPEEGESGSNNTSYPAGLITAGAWDDNENYTLWTELFFRGQTVEENGKFASYTGDNAWHFTTEQRVRVTVLNGEAPVAGAEVVATDVGGAVLYRAVSNAAGVAYLFPNAEAGNVSLAHTTGTVSVPFTKEQRDLTLSVSTAAAKNNAIELMFVVDVTGSMGDELSYLNNEIADVVNRVVVANPGVQIRLALLFYRDHTDSETFAYFDFTDVTNKNGLEAVQSTIRAQRATGGGDTPEAVEDALKMAIEKQWSSDSTTRILFQILDAPPHSGSENRKNFYDAVLCAAEKGIRICPVICSGANSLTEYLMRQAALSTGGTFVFVTDDSGIGNSHHDPQLPNVTVEALNSLIVRLINGYHTGTFAPPVYWKQDAQK